MCKSPDILRPSRSCFLTTLNLYVQIRELGTRRRGQLRKTWSILRSSRSSCSEAQSCPRTYPRFRSVFFSPAVPRSPSEHPASGADLRTSCSLASGSFVLRSTFRSTCVRFPRCLLFYPCIPFLYEHLFVTPVM